MKNNHQQKHHVLLTGCNGLVGKSLTQALLREGHRVSHLSRTPSFYYSTLVRVAKYELRVDIEKKSVTAPADRKPSGLC